MIKKRGSLTGAVIVLILGVVLLTISAVLGADASAERACALTSMNASVDLMYSSNDPNYNARYQGEISAEKLRRAAVIGRLYHDALSTVYFFAFLGWISIVTALISALVMRKRKKAEKEKVRIELSHSSEVEQVTLVDHSRAPNPKVIRRNRLIAAIFLVSLFYNFTFGPGRNLYGSAGAGFILNAVWFTIINLQPPRWAGYILSFLIITGLATCYKILKRMDKDPSFNGMDLYDKERPD